MFFVIDYLLYFMHTHSNMHAGRERGMRSIGMTQFRLRAQLEEWLELSTQKGIPIFLLIMSRAFMLASEGGAAATSSSGKNVTPAAAAAAAGAAPTAAAVAAVPTTAGAGTAATPTQAVATPTTQTAAAPAVVSVAAPSPTDAGQVLKSSMSFLDRDTINEVVLQAASRGEADTTEMRRRRLESLQFQKEVRLFACSDCVIC